MFICHVGWEVTADVTRRLADGIDPEIIRSAEAAAGSVPGVVHAHARARWTGRSLRVEIEGWVDPATTARDADVLGRQVAAAIAAQVPEAGSVTWASRAAPMLLPAGHRIPGKARAEQRHRVFRDLARALALR